MTENEIYANTLRDIVERVDLCETDTEDMHDMLVNIGNKVNCALVDGTVARQFAAYLHAQRIEYARLRALAI